MAKTLRLLTQQRALPVFTLSLQEGFLDCVVSKTLLGLSTKPDDVTSQKTLISSTRFHLT